MYIAQRKENISRCSVWAAATASLLLLLLTSSSSSFADATIELSLDPPDFDVASVTQFQSNAPVSGTCASDLAQCGEYSVARAIQNGNTAQGGYCSVGGGDTNNAAAQKSVIAVRTAVVRSSYLVGIMVQAKEYKFQVKNDPGSDNENILFLNADNIELLQAAIDTPSERRVLRPDHVLRRERRGRKLQAVREQYGLN